MLELNSVNSVIFYLGVLTASFSTSLWVAQSLLSYVSPKWCLDKPSGRKIHTVATPRFGGFSFVPVSLLFMVLLLDNLGSVTWFIAGATAIFLCGVADDYKTLSWKVKLPIHLVIGIGTAIYFLQYIDSVSFFGHVLPMAKPLIVGVYVFFFLGMMNAVNLVDGLDGLAGGVVFLISLGAIVVGVINGSADFFLLNLLVAGPLLGFLQYNNRPAKFFMGDNGSLFLGYYVATLPFLYFSLQTSPTSTIDITPFLLMTSYLLVDTTRVFFLRASEGRNPLEPDNIHFHHELLKKTSNNVALLVIFSLVGASIFSSIFYVKFSFGRTAMLIYLVIIGSLSFFKFTVEGFLSFVTTFVPKCRKSLKNSAFALYTSMEGVLAGLLTAYGLVLALISMNALDLAAFFPLFPGVTMGVLFLMLNAKNQVARDIFVLGLSLIQFLVLISMPNPQGNTILFALVVVKNSLAAGILTAVALSIIAKPYQLFLRFWSVVDLLILITLSGFVGLRLAGLEIPAISEEFVLIYVAGKVVIPKMMANKEGSVLEVGKSSIRPLFWQRQTESQPAIKETVTSN